MKVNKSEIKVAEGYLIDLDTGNDVLLKKDVYDLLSVNGGLVESFFEENGARDVLTKTGCCNK